MNKQINYLFAMSKNDSAYLNELTKSLVELGTKIARSILKKYNIYTIILEDVEDYILYVVYGIIISNNTYDMDFEHYAKYVLYKRLTNYIMEKCIASSAQVDSLDEMLLDGTPIIDLIPDKSVPIPDQVSLSEIKLKLSSPKANEREIERKKHKVFNLQCAGYSSKEIMQMLHLSEGQFRYLLKMLNADAKTFQYKIDIK